MPPLGRTLGTPISRLANCRTPFRRMAFPGNVAVFLCASEANLEFAESPLKLPLLLGLFA
jgi:hypothetical protein